MFGKYMVESEEISADEDWGPGRRKRRRNVSDAAGNRVALCDSDNDFSNVTRRKNVKKSSYNSEGRRKLFRIPPDAVKKLREVFAEDELPSRVVRENLSKQFGIALEKINKWFKNARYTALKIRKSSIGAGKIQGADAVASEDDPSLVSLATRVQRLRKLRRRKNSKLVTIPSRKKGEKSSTVLPTKNSDEVTPWLSKTVSSKKQIRSLKRKVALQKKKVNQTCSDNKELPYIVEIERICRLKEKIEKMKTVLLTIDNENNDVTDKPGLNKRPVVYVPVAELREKI